MGPLHGITVLDLTCYLSGPFCTMLLGDLGADVIKIEMPGGDPSRKSGPPFIDGESSYFLQINRNKRSIVLDLKKPEGHALFLKLAREADAVVENFRPGVMDNLGLGYDRLRAENPRLVYCAISGFGQDGPRAHLPAFDHVIQGYSGWMSITGDPAHGPSRAGPSVGDLMSGLFATIGTVSALHARAETGRGQRVTTSLLEALTATLMPHQSAYFGTGQAPKAEGNAHPIIVPFGTYATADGHMNVAVATAGQWRELCAALGIAGLGDNPDYASNAGRAKHRAEVHDAIAAALKAATSAAWLEKFNAIGIPCAPVYNIPQALDDPQARHNQAVVEMLHPTVGTVRTINHPIRMERTPASEWRPPPTLGQHTQEILARIGVDETELAALKTKGVI